MNENNVIDLKKPEQFIVDNPITDSLHKGVKENLKITHLWIIKLKHRPVANVYPPLKCLYPIKVYAHACLCVARRQVTNSLIIATIFLFYVSMFIEQENRELFFPT
jgi:hypothetical protein